MKTSAAVMGREHAEKWGSPPRGELRGTAGRRRGGDRPRGPATAVWIARGTRLNFLDFRTREPLASSLAQDRRIFTQLVLCLLSGIAR